ncbi:hypothetical protein [Natronobacterium gregoryi]|uniref:Uncharacterized protein n=1 Tax=Natronobacterium gregoryi (strain ATCC 43098 / DSM 3393 / CCM 3738 / CIP 104747 / IAM 13177 / JCM 8860 / NBRC 102187 / NCIMB 2189 / SP2) TaxID=797304 RepID=L9Y4S7_NATGS|nr:hypothetical protein [Natronobacterium gregoryi]ELY67888.1 hypothetical protein C490_10350 [Natronobacterium gregoryi SP2]PLK20006.1 hypothetical protein CYV19_11850 [Natronobacterium gregoryi SP2]
MTVTAGNTLENQSQASPMHVHGSTRRPRVTRGRGHSRRRHFENGNASAVPDGFLSVSFVPLEI